MKLRRQKYEALRVPCPRCGVYEWHPCAAKDGTDRKSFHAERHAKAKLEKPILNAKRKPRPFDKTWAITRAKVFALKGSQCAYCGAPASHVDHQTPKARGGSDDIGNLVPCCQPCNVAKGMMTLEEWRG